MQFAKDSFYLALRDRLAALDPERKVLVDGVERPAILVIENKPVNAAPPLPNAYYLAWGRQRGRASIDKDGVPRLVLRRNRNGGAG